MYGRKTGMQASAEALGRAGTSNELYELHDRIDRLTMVVEALWSVLEDEGYDRAALEAKLDQLDLADGTADGKTARSTERCPQCGAAVHAGSPICQICGEPNEHTDPFAGV